MRLYLSRYGPDEQYREVICEDCSRKHGYRLSELTIGACIDSIEFHDGTAQVRMALAPRCAYCDREERLQDLHP